MFSHKMGGEGEEGIVLISRMVSCEIELGRGQLVGRGIEEERTFVPGRGMRNEDRMDKNTQHNSWSSEGRRVHGT